MSGLLVVLVVVGVSLFPRAGGPGGAPGAGSGSGSVGATPFMVAVHELAWLEAAPDGSYSLMQTSVREVCPSSGADCAPLGSVTSIPLRFALPPRALLLSPSHQELVVVTSASSPGGGDVLVITVPTPIDSGSSPAISGEPTAPSAAATTPTAPETPTLASPAPTTASGSAEPTAGLVPVDGRAIATGVIVVGDAAYSADGQWLAFAARPATGEVGPDLYLWRVGDALASAVTADHRTFFAGWLGDLMLASRIEPGQAAPEAGLAATPSPSGDPASSPTPAPSSSLGPTEAPSPVGSPDASPAPDASPLGSPAATSDALPTAGPDAVEEHPVSFLMDPGSGTVIPMAGTDVWHPTVDPSGQLVTYWSGTLVPDVAGTTWHLGTGRLVLDRWQSGSQLPSETAAPSETVAPSGTASVPAATEAGSASQAPTIPVYGPAGLPVAIAEGAVPDFDAWFDPTGTRLAVWIEDPADPGIGLLRLLVLDQRSGTVDPSIDPLPGVAALRGVSIDAGRMVWVTPPGPDGEGSHVQVLAWNDHDFGQVRTIPARHLFVVR